MTDNVTFYMTYGDLKIKFKKSSYTSVKELKEIATNEFNVEDPLLSYYDEEDEDWYLIQVSMEFTQDFTSADKVKLKVKPRTSDQKGKINTSQLPLPEGKPQPETATESSLPAPADVTNPSDTVDGRKPQQPPVADAVLLSRYMDEIQKVVESKSKSMSYQGVAFVIGMSDAAGTDLDVANMAKVLSGKLNFAVVMKTNLSSAELRNLIEAAARSQYDLRCKYILFYYAGHGGITAQGHSFVTSSSSLSPDSDVVYIYHDIINVLEHTKKCLLFFFDCCQNNKATNSIQSPPDLDVERIKHKDPNCLIAKATFFGEIAQGDSKIGGYWTRKLSEKLADSRELVSMLSEVQVEVREKYKQAPTMIDNLKKKVNLKDTAKSGGIDLLEQRPIPIHMDDVLKEYTATYTNIGMYLGVSFAARQAITVNPVYLTLDQKMSAVAEKWLQETKNPTWKKFIEAMKKNKMNKLAADTEKYLKDMPDDKIEAYLQQLSA